ncbi:hypothetical protein EII35_06560 [Arachnia propionica]|uniref:Uncharacterized protein n=2 Tax=Arachnia propionica TaxID=1750 RepID=A0A3P1WUY1_9ACTN|nr:hypothetical protein EII35_06560 [Arachnia propionica]
MAWHDQAATKPPETLIRFTERLESRGIELVEANMPDSLDQGKDFIADTPIGRIWIIALKNTWTLRLAAPGAKYFANASDWKACREGRLHNWRTPTLDESIEWLTQVLSEGIPGDISIAKLDRLAGFRVRHGRTAVWLASTGIAIALLALSLSLFWVASVTNNSIARVNGVFCLIIFIIYLAKCAKAMWILRK